MSHRPPMTDEEAMLLAIQEAQKGWGFTYHNPMVGCVILDSQNCFLSSGYHAKWGGPHAEVNALKNLSQEQLKGAQVFVTLEPCAHEGKTPSCAKKLASLPIARVVYGLRDPNPLVAGQGYQIIEQAGVRCELFSGLQNQLEQVCESFLWNMREQKTFVSLKMATSLDGQMALANGESQWITGEMAREYSHYLRAGYEAILIGVETLLKDNPSLNIRHSQFVDKKNKVVVLDPEGKSLSMLGSMKISHVREKEDIFIVIGESVTLPSGSLSTQVIRCALSNSEFNLSEVLNHLYQRKIKSLFVEGGPKTISLFLKQKIAQRVYLFMAPKILGEGRSWSQGLHHSSLLQVPQIKNIQTQQFGEDVFLTGFLTK